MSAKDQSAVPWKHAPCLHVSSCWVKSSAEDAAPKTCLWLLCMLAGCP